MIDQLGRLAEIGFQAAIGAVTHVWQVRPLEVIAAEASPPYAASDRAGGCGPG